MAPVMPEPVAGSRDRPCCGERTPPTEKWRLAQRRDVHTRPRAGTGAGAESSAGPELGRGEGRGLAGDHQAKEGQVDGQS